MLASRGKWYPTPHLNYLTKRLVDLEQRRITRLFVEMPPRHGKSNLCSQYFPAWYLGRHPDHSVILASYEAGFSQFWGERARDTLKEFGPEVFGVGLHPKKQKAADWRVDGHTGRMRCTGVAAGMTGRGADLLIIDDPIKDAIEASSEVYRTRVWDWYSTVARSRLEPNGVIVVIQTRWHMDDLIGKLRQQAALGGESWDACTMQAINETPDDPLGRGVGEALWPSRYDVQALLGIKNTIPGHWWEALYQQRPVPPGGSMAKSLWLQPVMALPRGNYKYCRYWDCAGTEKRPGADPDWTVGAKLARHEDGRYFIVDIVRLRKTFGEVEATMKQMAIIDGPECIIREEQEPGSAGLAVVSARRKALAGFNYKGVPKRHQKEVAWQPLLIQAEVGNVYMVAGPWNQAFLAEWSQVPHGSHDDQMDAASGAFSELARGSAVPAADLLGIGGGEKELRAAMERKIF